MNETRLFSLRKTFSVTFAYVGILTGAGLASGQEIIQYFISFGLPGYIGVVATAILFMLFGRWIIALGSYYRADNHMDVLSEVSHPIISKLLDFALSFACFVMSFVMIAGAGSNVAQQFGVPAWVGSLICALLILAVSYMDFDKVTAALGVFTPMMLIVVAIGLFALVTGPEVDWNSQFAFASTVESSLSNVVLSVINYFGLCLMISTSMLFVLGGNVIDLDSAKHGGTLGGFFAGLISFIVATLLVSKIDVIATDDVPMLTFMTEIHPLLGLFMFMIIFGMIFNTGFSVSYALGKRIANNDESKMKWIMPIIVAISFALSFVGFTELMAIMYPILGYIGMILIVTIIIGWLNDRSDIKKESGVRAKIFKLMMRREDDNQDFTHKHAKEMSNLYDESNTENKELYDEMSDLVDQRTDSDSTDD